MALDPPMPLDFATGPYETIQQRISVDLGEGYAESLQMFAGAWNAVRYRYLACVEHDQSFTSSIQQQLTPLERYHQERDLFGFFVSGLSTIESLCYGLYAVASIIEPAGFAIRTQQDLRGVTP